MTRPGVLGAMSRVPDWVTLTDREQVVWRGGPSPIKVAWELLGEAVVVIVGLAIAAATPTSVAGVPIPEAVGLLGLLLAVLGLLAGLLTYLRYDAVTYLITTEEVYVKRGLFSRSVTNLRLDRIQDCGFEQSRLQRVLGYGDVYVSTAGRSGVELVFEDVPRPSTVNGYITEELDATQSRR